MFFSLASYSQVFCDYGDYSPIFNKINGIGLSKFKKVELKKKDKIIYTINYNKHGRTIRSNYNESLVGPISYDNPCIDFDDEQKIENEYQYDNDFFPKEIIVKTNDKIEKALIKYDSITKKVKKINFNHFEIKYKYYENGLLKSIKKDNTLNEFFWNSNNLLSKIITTPTQDPFESIDILEYDKNHNLKEIRSLVTWHDGYEIFEYVRKYHYSNKTLEKITGESFKIENKKKIKMGQMNYYLFDYKHDNKLTIKILGKNKKYIEHFECYY